MKKLARGICLFLAAAIIGYGAMKVNSQPKKESANSGEKAKTARPSTWKRERFLISGFT